MEGKVFFLYMWACAFYFCLLTDSSLCYDESEKCKQFAKEGKCTSAALHKYANYCKKSCGLCGKLPYISYSYGMLLIAILVMCCYSYMQEYRLVHKLLLIQNIISYLIMLWLVRCWFKITEYLPEIGEKGSFLFTLLFFLFMAGIIRFRTSIWRVIT